MLFRSVPRCAASIASSSRRYSPISAACSTAAGRSRRRPCRCNRCRGRPCRRYRPNHRHRAPQLRRRRLVQPLLARQVHEFGIRFGFHGVKKTGAPHHPGRPARRIPAAGCSPIRWPDYGAGLDWNRLSTRMDPRDATALRAHPPKDQGRRRKDGNRRRPAPAGPHLARLVPT